MKSRDFVNQANIQRRMKMSKLELEMSMFAFECHNGQFRKFGFEPYICHPAEVASIVSQVTNDPETLAAAWGHDIVEDCGVDIGLVEAKFGKLVAQRINWLSNPSQTNPEFSKLSRVERKRIDREHLISADAGTKTVKLADILSNINSLVYNDPSFARTWVKEKELLLPYLEGGSVELYSLVKSNVLNSKDFLKI